MYGIRLAEMRGDFSFSHLLGIRFTRTITVQLIENEE